MGHDFIEKRDNLLTKKECFDIIQLLKVNTIPDRNKEKYTGYDWCNIMDRGADIGKSFASVPLRPLYNSILKLKDCYIDNNPEVCHISPWNLDYVRFKWWKPGNYYSHWHSEHSFEASMRVISFLIYLSDNDSHTEFKRHRNVKMKAGRGIIFPAYFTHEHRGSICKKGLDRFIASGYFSFI